MSIGFGNVASVLSSAPRFSLSSGRQEESVYALKVSGAGSSVLASDSPPGRAVSAAAYPRVGFGENTLSISAAALQALSHTIEDAKDLVARLQEVQQEKRVREAELAAKSQAAAGAGAPPAASEEQAAASTVFQRPEAAPQALAFTSGENSTSASRFDVASEPQDQSLTGAGVPPGLLTTNSLNLLI